MLRMGEANRLPCRCGIMVLFTEHTYTLNKISNETNRHDSYLNRLINTLMKLELHFHGAISIVALIVMSHNLVYIIYISKILYYCSRHKTNKIGKQKTQCSDKSKIKKNDKEEEHQMRSLCQHLETIL